MTETKQLSEQKLVNDFLEYFRTNKKLFARSVIANYESQPENFNQLGYVMLNWAKNYLGTGYLKPLADGYVSFVIDVNKSQTNYEKEKHYKNKTYKEVFESVYNNEAHMQFYHWGVYVTTFAWQHHLNIYTFFKNYFIPLLNKTGNALDLGSGSGIWSMLLSHNLSGWKITGVDISQPSVSLSTEMARLNNFSDLKFQLGDALTFKSTQLFDACVSCFLLEHLETPHLLIRNISENLPVGGYAFITGALTAAEVDHIFEFKNESEIISLCEKFGFRVIATLSASPSSHPRNNYFLPRSMALVLQKKSNEIW